jgi:hypothetical protein
MEAHHWIRISLGLAASLGLGALQAIQSPPSPVRDPSQHLSPFNEGSDHAEGIPRWWGKAEYPPIEAVHSVVQSFWNEGIVELEDGSRWLVDDGSVRLLGRFPPGTRVTFRPTSRWFGAGNFDLVALQSNISLQVAAYEGPRLDSPYLRTLAAAMFAEGWVQLSDGTVWEIDPAYAGSGEMASWALNDVIMIGQNPSGWWRSLYPALLFNCGANHSVPSRRVQ